MKARPLSGENYEHLMHAAKQAREKAYAPYSCFPVGAAILFEDDRVVTGCNVENASYGLTICAERTAMCAAVSLAYGKPIAVAIAGDNGRLCPPCGACRQFLFEFNPQMLVILEDNSGLIAYRLSDLLPVSFSADELSEVEK